MDPVKKKELADIGIRIEQWISGYNYQAVCQPDFPVNNISESGIKNMYALPPELKINTRLLNYSEKAPGPRDLIAVTCFLHEQQVD